MLKKTCFVVCCGLAAIVASPASSENFNISQFIGIDRDADNMISKTEAMAYRQRYFDTLDANEDGKVTFEEYVKANNLRSNTANPDSKVPVPQNFKNADANGDTALSIDEFQMVGAKKFAILDKNNDGMVSKAEFVKPGL